MSEWWTYTLSDFLLFSPRTYHRLFELYNRAIWPAQVPAVLIGALIAVLARRRSAANGRIIAVLFAACWLWVAFVFHARHYAAVNWAAVYFAWGFGIEAALLVAIGAIRGASIPTEPSRIGAGMLIFAVFVQPLVGPLLGRSWREVEIFGVTPDPTAVATLGVLLPTRGAAGWVAAALPTVWCAVSGATLVAMKDARAAIPLGAALLATGARIGARHRRPES